MLKIKIKDISVLNTKQVYEYTCERDVYLRSVLLSPFRRASMSSSLNSEILFSDIFNKDTSDIKPNDRLLDFEYFFKKGDIIRGTFQYMAGGSVNQKDSIILIEKSDVGFVNG